MRKPENIKSETWKEIERLISSERKIEAIKLYREATGQGLKESKDFIDDAFEQINKENPYKIGPKKSGCGTTILLFSILPVLAYLIFNCAV